MGRNERHRLLGTDVICVGAEVMIPSSNHYATGQQR